MTRSWPVSTNHQLTQRATSFGTAQVERTFAWINRCRRTVRDYERLPDHHAAMVQWSMVILMTRRLARYQRRQPRPQAA
jgi:transposase